MKRYTAEIDATLPIIAIDMGYSANNPSCGFAHSGTSDTHSLRFGDCIAATLKRMTEQGPHLLILEAVLSTYHRPDGNPDIRGDFEKGRGWYYGPGVSTFAAALRFLQELDRQLPASRKPIPLVEGFLSYKQTRTQHCDDAQRLLEEFETAERFQARNGSDPISPQVAGTPLIIRYNAPHGSR
ncbi:MAG: hypothetical protein ACI8Z5_000956 [Lentimonas sp.]